MNRRNYLRTIGATAFTPAVSIASNELKADEFIAELPDEVNGKKVGYNKMESDEYGVYVSAHIRDYSLNQIYYQEDGPDEFYVNTRGVGHTADSIPEAVSFASAMMDAVDQNMVFRQSGKKLRRVAYTWYLFAGERIVDPRYAHTEGDNESTYYYYNGETRYFKSSQEKRSDISRTIKEEVGWSSSKPDSISRFLQKTHFG